MKVVVLGATGTTGQLVIAEALAKSYEVIAFVRRPDTLQERSGLAIIQGSVDNQSEMQECFSDADTAISCLGVRPGLRSLRHGSNLQRRTLPKIIAAINEAGVKRFILMSSFGSGETRKKAALFIKVVLYSFLAKKCSTTKS